jgi:hypothetical protein
VEVELVDGMQHQLTQQLVMELLEVLTQEVVEVQVLGVVLEQAVLEVLV